MEGSGRFRESAVVSAGFSAEPVYQKAEWPFRLDVGMSAERLEKLHADIDALDQGSKYGWGHTIDFGPFEKKGHLGDNYLFVAGALQSLGWWPADGAHQRIADIGCFSGGITTLLTRTGASVVAVEELPENLAQCALVLDAFGIQGVELIGTTLYRLKEHIAPESLDYILLSGVLYHLSDMLAGLIMMQTLLKPGGVLVIETNAIDCLEHSYANFGRFYGGMWWQPTSRCVQDMCEFSGLTKPEVHFYVPGRCLARCVKEEGHVPFRRGINFDFGDIGDRAHRSLDRGTLPPIPCRHEAGEK